jgi:glutamine---fructose-6-phosphate transaminase (isomerizing)
MCGIIGIVSQKEFSTRSLLESLKRLEYRGYDSYGYYDGKILEKKVGGIVVAGEDRTKAGISHTRWATHGGVTEENAHPHISCDGKVVAAHNGIIENFRELRSELEKKGHVFKSQTDSEIIAHYFEEKLKKTKDIKKIIPMFLRDIRGTFAVLLMIEGVNEIYAIKRDSPMVLGICKGRNILASDIYAFSDKTDQAIFFDNDEFAEVKDSSYEFYDCNGRPIRKSITEFHWKQDESKKSQFKHFMQKEIDEEPEAVSRLLLSLEHEQKDAFNSLVSLIKKSKKIIFAACGTSYHASLLGAYYLHKTGVESQTLIASEFRYYANVDKDTLVIAISQSGETMDVIDALNYAKEKHAKIVSFVNVPYSTIQRMSELTLNIMAGQEVAVASTKAFVNQAVLLLRIAQAFGYPVNIANVSEKIKLLLDQKDKLKKIGEGMAQAKDAYMIGRGQTYPVAREIALKIKEIAYIHAEGMMGGELKHGTMALIEKGTPVICMISSCDSDMVSNTNEVEARGAKIIIITNNRAYSRPTNSILIDTDNDGKFGILACIAGQLIAYYAADALGRPIDKPRNLAKSVTVK